MKVIIGNKPVGQGCPVYIIAEIGINHNGDLGIAKKLIDVAVQAGCDAVKFQKRVPKLCVPDSHKEVKRDTPWGIMSYIEYRERVEFGRREYEEIDDYCLEKQIQWFASSWDPSSVEFIEQFNPPCHKVPSALLTDHRLLQAFADTGRPVIMSTGMSTMEEIEKAAKLFSKERLLLAHSTSIYPCPLEKLNLRMIETLKNRFNCIVGYSGHEVGLSPSYAATVMGSAFIERHVTLDRAMWGSDHAASVEPGGLRRLVENIRDIEKALGDGVKVLYEEERRAMKRLRNNVSKPAESSKEAGPRC